MWIIEVIDGVHSKNTLRTILEVIVATSPPVVKTLCCQHVNVALGLLEGHPFASGENPILQVPDKWAAPYEARQVTLAH